MSSRGKCSAQTTMRTTALLRSLCLRLSAKLLGKTSPEQKRLCISVYSTDSLPRLFNYIGIRKVQQRELIMKPSCSVQVHDSHTHTKKKKQFRHIPKRVCSHWNEKLYFQEQKHRRFSSTSLDRAASVAVNSSQPSVASKKPPTLVVLRLRARGFNHLAHEPAHDEEHMAARKAAWKRK